MWTAQENQDNEEPDAAFDTWMKKEGHSKVLLFKGQPNAPIFDTIPMLDAQWSNCPVEISEIVSAKWKYGNDRYYMPWTPGKAKANGPADTLANYHLDFFLKSKGVTSNCLLHYWW